MDPGLLEQMPLLGPLVSASSWGAKSERLLQLYVVCTIGMFRSIYGNNAMLLRRNVWKDDLLKERVIRYTNASSTSPRVIGEWEIGTIGHYAGFHCSWCYSPEGIRTKLLSAQKDDKPRWGDFPEKTNVTYIRSLIGSGGWFDDTHPFIPVVDTKDKSYAPKYMMDNVDRFRYLLVRPDG